MIQTILLNSRCSVMSLDDLYLRCNLVVKRSFVSALKIVAVCSHVFSEVPQVTGYTKPISRPSVEYISYIKRQK
jgi:hypothetical protein